MPLESRVQLFRGLFTFLHNLKNVLSLDIYIPFNNTNARNVITITKTRHFNIALPPST